MAYVESVQELKRGNQKSKISNPKQITSTKISNSKRYDLEDRTLEFGKRIIRMCRTLPKNNINFRLIDQIMRSGCSIGANYREANETETKKDFLFRLKIARKEGKETIYWLNLIIEANADFTERIKPLRTENE